MKMNITARQFAVFGRYFFFGFTGVYPVG